MIAGYALGLEISTLSAIASGQFASAHEKLGRNHPELGFRQKDFDATFFSSVLGVDCTLIDAISFDVRIVTSEYNKCALHLHSTAA